MNDWKGQTAVVIASGPSLTQAQCDLVREAGVRSIVINTSYRLAPWADALYGCAIWWKYNIDKVRKEFHGQLWTEGTAPAKQYGLHWIRSASGAGLSRDPSYVHRGGGARGYCGHSGYQAVNLAYHWGAKRIVLLGFDMKKSGEKKNWHEQHVLNIQSPYELWVKNFKPLAIDLETEGVELLNATTDSALDCVRKVSLEEALGARVVLAA